MPTPTQYYNAYAHDYDHQRSQDFYPLINSLELNELIKFCRGKKVLEVGCGTGALMKELQPFAKEITGVDFSETMLSYARQKGLNVHQADATQLPFDDATFDVVFSVKVLPHVQNITKALKEMTRVCKPGGFICPEFYNPLGPKGISNFIKYFFKKRDIWIRHDTPFQARKYFPKNTLEITYFGIRIFSFTSKFYQHNTRTLKHLEQKYYNKKYYRFFGSYLLFILQKI